MRSLCVIPARSGSKGLKDKNILDLCGKPVLAYSIECCLQSNLFDEVFVATDSEEYAKIAKRYGASVPFLEPEEMAADDVSSTEPLLYFDELLGRADDLLWCIQPTSPLRSVQDLIDAHKLFEEDDECDFVLGTTKVDPHYFHWVLKDGDNGTAHLHFGSEVMVDRSLLRPLVYRPNGAIKVGRRAAVRKYKHFFGGRIKRVEMPEDRAIHIRSKLDLDLCRIIMMEGKNA